MDKLSPIALVLFIALGLGCHDIHLNYDQSPGEITVYDDLYSVSAGDDRQAVAVGYYGSAYFTEDGGETWKQGVTGTLSSLYNVAMANGLKQWHLLSVKSVAFNKSIMIMISRWKYAEHLGHIILWQ